METLREAQASLLRERVLEAACELIGTGEDVTFAKVAATAAVPERTVYRHFPNRQALVAALFEHTNRRIGFVGELPTTPAAMAAMVWRVFPGFDTVAPVIAELVASPDGRQARLANAGDRRMSANAVVSVARPDLDPERAGHIAAVVQVLGTAPVWQALRDFWDMDGAQAAAAVTTALEILLADPTTGGT